MWFLINAPAGAAIEVQNVDDFTWFSSSYSPVLRQFESARMIEYYFKAHQASSLTSGSDNLKYRNPKYLSMLNHLSFYLPRVYPKLDKVLFLDDDIVVPKDLTPLWTLNLHGMEESGHHWNISSLARHEGGGWRCPWGASHGRSLAPPPEECPGASMPFGMSRACWTRFYNLTYPLDRSWHALGLGYNPALNQTEIENAAVVHYNGNYKPRLDLAIGKYKSYWPIYVMFDNLYLQLSNLKD
ncbi:hypothetical protein RD792_017071 [Penstemon davidsonii]|uniref:Hexosyltransferase n=1 Tax=Penstemon davidsonii TaxID=160366 RepID=A0ABR0CLY4_9LAMI|nr:hypothetical protein RD792_017071 [Penstemon davidsonii]